jgi:regulator of nonsense transcripts 1
MIQFSKPKKTLAAALDPFRQREAPASEYLARAGSATVPSPGSNRFDPAFYRSSDSALDSQSIEQAMPNLPVLPGSTYAKGKATYGGYANSIVSQQPADSAPVPSQSTLGHSQFDRLGDQPVMQRPRRKLSIGSLAPSDAPTASTYGFGYKAGEDDARSVATSQSGVTDF